MTFDPGIERIDSDISADIQEVLVVFETVDPGNGFRFLGGKGIGAHQRHMSEIAQSEQTPPVMDDGPFPRQYPFRQRPAEALDGFSEACERAQFHFIETP
jgi:hypothetical protein